MLQSESDIRSRAAALAEELAAGLRSGRAVEWLEEVAGTALLDVARTEFLLRHRRTDRTASG